ncbi:MAG TPA: hypothetical protein VNJ53_06400 [Gaiellaceae bacterium]|nr:hypothetical protein [Gaiellaceae bacterium]
MVRAAPVLSRRRALALGAGAVVVAGYASAAEHLFSLREAWDVAFVGLLVLPASLALVWLVLPLARVPYPRLLLAAVPLALAAVAFELADYDGGFNVAKLLVYALLGLAFLGVFELLWWVTLIAVLVPWVDAWSVASGPTRHVIDERPGLLERLAVASPFPGENAAIFLGPPDLLFFALFLGAAARFGLRVGWTFAGMAGLLSATFALVVFGDVSGLPALPAVCLGFLLPNADLLWRDARVAFRARRTREPAG